MQSNFSYRRKNQDLPHHSSHQEAIFVVLATILKYFYRNEIRPSSEMVRISKGNSNKPGTLEGHKLIFGMSQHIDDA